MHNYELALGNNQNQNNYYFGPAPSISKVQIEIQPGFALKCEAKSLRPEELGKSFHSLVSTGNFLLPGFAQMTH